MSKGRDSYGFLKLKDLDGDKLVAMCDSDVIRSYGKQLKLLCAKLDKVLVNGCVEYTSDVTECAVFYLHSRPIYMAAKVPEVIELSVKKLINLQKPSSELLKLCDYPAVFKMTMEEQSFEIPCAVLDIDKGKRRKQLQTQVWFDHDDIVKYTPEEMDWVCKKLIGRDLDPLVVSREKLYGEDAVFMCGLIYKGDLG